MNKAGLTIVWDKLVTILLALLVLIFLLLFAYFVYQQMSQTKIPGLI